LVTSETPLSKSVILSKTSRKKKNSFFLMILSKYPHHITKKHEKEVRHFKSPTSFEVPFAGDRFGLNNALYNTLQKFWQCFT
jgi:hypothetical protein